MRKGLVLVMVMVEVGAEGSGVDRDAGGDVEKLILFL